MRATINTMNIFVRAVEANNFLAAARSLLIDPAAVGRAIKSLGGSGCAPVRSLDPRAATHSRRYALLCRLRSNSEKVRRSHSKVSGRPCDTARAAQSWNGSRLDQSDAAEGAACVSENTRRSEIVLLGIDQGSRSAARGRRPLRGRKSAATRQSASRASGRGYAPAFPVTIRDVRVARLSRAGGDSMRANGFARSRLRSLHHHGK